MEVLLSAYPILPLGILTTNVSEVILPFYIIHTDVFLYNLFIYLFTKNALVHISEAAIYFLNELYTMDMFPSQCIDLIHFNIACFFV